jgi:hypothetical protein
MPFADDGRPVGLVTPPTTILMHDVKASKQNMLAVRRAFRRLIRRATYTMNDE